MSGSAVLTGDEWRRTPHIWSPATVSAAADTGCGLCGLPATDTIHGTAA